MASAFADAGNPILGTIQAKGVDNGDGTVTVYVRGQWNWISHNSDCNFDRAATGVGIAWQDLNGPGTTRGRNEVQRVALTGTITGGTIRLKFGGQKTGNIAYDASAATMQTALEGLSTIGAGNVSVTQSTAPPNTAWDITFVNALGAADVAQLGLDNKSLTGAGTGVSITTVTPGSFAVYNGYLVANGNIRAYVGYKDPTTVGGGRDRMVHPVDLGNVPEGYTEGTWQSTAFGYPTNAAGDYPLGQQFIDPPINATTGLGSYTAWKGGCGREPLTATASKGSHSEKTGQPCAIQIPPYPSGTSQTQCAGHPWGSWGYQDDDATNAGLGYSHTYLKEIDDPDNPGETISGLPDRICVNFYDVHGGGKANSTNFQLVNGAKEITVDLAGDNSIDTNAFNVNDGANCISIVATGLTTEATDADVGEDIFDTATLSGPVTTGTIHFKVFGPSEDDTPDCSGSPADEFDVPTTGPGQYESKADHDFTTTEAGFYFWTAEYTDDDALVLGATSACGAENETSTVAKKQPTLTTDAGADFVLLERCDPNDPNNLSLCADLFDTATLDDAYNPTGAVSFALYSDADCTEEVDDSPVGIEDDKAVEDFYPGTFNSKTITVHESGTYHWIATYEGDKNNEGASNECDEAEESVRVVNPDISIIKTACVTDGTDDFPLADRTADECAGDGETLTIHSGDEVTYTIVIENTGDDDLTDLSVDDDTFDGCDRTTDEIDDLIADQHPTNDPGTLEPGQSITYDCTTTLEDSVTNTATVTASEPSGGTVTDNDDADVEVIEPDIDVTKTACISAGTDDYPLADRTADLCAADGETLVVHVGDTVTYTITIENTGDVPLSNIVVDDDAVDECDRDPVFDTADGKDTDPPGADELTLDPGETFDYECSVEVGEDDIANTATATGDDELGGTVDEDDDALTDVIHPSLTIVKELDDGQTDEPLVGTTVKFKITVTNTGDVDLTNIAIDDDIAPGCERDPLYDTADGNDTDPPGADVLTLAAKQDDGQGGFVYDSFTYTCELEDVQLDVLENTAEACAEDPIGGITCEDDDVPFTPQKRKPQLTTDAGEDIVLGTGDLTDEATLGDCADPDAEGCPYEPSGTITFELYGPDDEDCDGPAIFTSDPVDVDNGVGPYASDPPFTPTVAGTYRWIAEYSGDDNNEGFRSECNDPGEDVVVLPNTSSVDTEQNLLPNDKAIVTGGSVQPTGNVLFELFDNADCDGDPVYDELVTLVAGTGLEANAETSNDGDTNTGGFIADGSGTWYWRVSYEGDQNNEDSESACGVEIFTIDNDTKD